MSLKVLVIEDDPRCTELLRAKLAGSEFDLTFVSTLAAGLAKLNAERWDRIILDLGLPDSKDDATFYEVKAHRGEAKILVLTGDNDPSVRDHMRRAGADNVAVKGIDDRAADLKFMLTHEMHKRKRK